jgi:hypothetical protein
MAKVYVSSTYLDLTECRERVRLTLRRINHEDVAMEYYVAEDQRPLDRCLADVADCDLYLGVFAFRYGWIPPENNPDELSITELEYSQAIENEKPCLVFLLSEDASWPAKFIDKDRSRIEKLRNRLSRRHFCGFFVSPENLARLVAESIHNWERTNDLIAPRSKFPGFDRSKYFAVLAKRYQRLDLDALTPPNKEEEMHLQLRSIFVEPNVRDNLPPLELTKDLWDKLQGKERIPAQDWPETVSPEDVFHAREAYYEKPSPPVFDILMDSRHQYTVILGDPGSGKSTLSRYILLSLIGYSEDERVRRTFNGYLPLLIELRSYSGLYSANKVTSFLEFVNYMGVTEGWHLNKEDLHQYLIKGGRALVIFDGLDEILTAEDREVVARRIVGFAADYPSSRIIVTSRVIGYRRNVLEAAGFNHFTLQDLDESQIATFVDQWYSVAFIEWPADAKERRDRLTRSLTQSESIRQLAGNPMLLTIMVIIGRHQELPRDRAKLYAHAASVLIQHWDAEKHLRDSRIDVSEDDKTELLRRVAFNMQTGSAGLISNYIYHERLVQEVERYLKDRYDLSSAGAAKSARAMIDHLRERNFILSLYGEDIYGFVHRGFLEYFCAAAFAHRFEKTRELTLEELKSVYDKHWQDRSWHEVLCLICRMIDERFAGEIIEFLIDDARYPSIYYSERHPPWNISLAMRCFAELRNLKAAAAPGERLLMAVCALFEEQLAGAVELLVFLNETIATTAELIGASWPKRSLLAHWLSQLRSFEYAWVYAEPLGRLIGSIGKGSNEIHQIILNYAGHHDKNYRTLAPITLAYGWRDDCQTFPLLISLAKDKAYGVRGAAIHALAAHFRHALEIELLRNSALKDESAHVRHMAFTALAEHFRDDSHTLPLIRNVAISDDAPFVRGTALATLADHFRDESQMSFLRIRSKEDPVEWVRKKAAKLVH